MSDSKVVTDIKVEPGYIDAILELMEQIALEVKVAQTEKENGIQKRSDMKAAGDQ